MSTDLEIVGWNAYFEDAFSPYQDSGMAAGRVMVEHKGSYVLYTRIGELTGEPTGKLLFSSASPADLPKVGDWVAVNIFEQEEKAIIHEVLPRKTKFSRKVAGKKVDEQIIATNIDLIFVVQSLDANFNLRRLERTLVLVHQSGAEPVVLLNKTDLDDHVKTRMKDTTAIAGDYPVIALSALTGDGLRKLRKLIKQGCTYAFIGSSGVGKSTLINRLVGEDIQKTLEVREKDGKGRHATTRRELIVLPTGGCVIDTPGMRELQLWEVSAGLGDAFPDIREIGQRCHFSDCTHTSEIKCAVIAAVEEGTLDQERYDNFVKLQKELAYLESRIDANTLLARKREEKKLHKEMRRRTKHKK